MQRMNKPVLLAPGNPKGNMFQWDNRIYILHFPLPSLSTKGIYSGFSE